MTMTVEREKLYFTKVLRLPDTKTGARNIVLSDAALELIRPAMQQVFICQRANGSDMYHCYAAWVRLRKKAGLPRFARMHDIRHTVASLAGRGGIGLSEVSRMLGHSRISTTEKYLHWLTGEASETAEKVAGLVGVK